MATPSPAPHPSLPDPDAHLTTAPLFSPSKARRDAATQRDWASVSNWLARQYAGADHGSSPAERPKMPRFERNDGTLSCLLALMRANEGADEERELVHRAQVEELERYEGVENGRRRRWWRKSDGNGGEEGGNDVIHNLLDEISSSLDSRGEESLISVATSTVSLGILLPTSLSSTSNSIITALLHRLTSLTHTAHATQTRTQLFKTLHSNLTCDITRTQQAIQLLRDSQSTDDEHEEHTRLQTAQWARETKQLALKAAEYRERVAGLQRFQIQGPAVEEVRERESGVEERRRGVRALERRVAEYCGLPADVEVAREEVRRAQGELAQLRRKRDGLFEMMVER